MIFSRLHIAAPDFSQFGFPIENRSQQGVCCAAAKQQSRFKGDAFFHSTTIATGMMASLTVKTKFNF
jgi:hypothetical protein